MVDLSHEDLDDLRSRMTQILDRLDFLFKQIAPTVQEIARLRQEASVIYDELTRRKAVPATAQNVKPTEL